jgi:RNA polymerase sigma-70 factor (ECF subfamily)
MTPFQALYERYAMDVYRFALFLAGNQAHAEDIASETFARAWTSSDRIRTGTVKAYLLGIARNVYREMVRKGARQTELRDDLPDRSPGPLEAAEKRSELEATLQAMQSLSENERTVLLMQAQEGLSHQQIAAALGISIAAVKVRIHRARLRLCSLLDPAKEKP